MYPIQPTLFSRFILFFLKLVLLLIIVSEVVAQDSSLSIDINEKLFESYLERADASDDQEQWRHWAQYGLETVLLEWETAAALVWADPDLIEEELQFLQSDLEERITDALTEWILEKFTQDTEGIDLSEFWSDVRSDALIETYEYDEDGEILRDDEGDFVIQATDEEEWLVESAEFMARWTEEAADRLKLWEIGADAAFSELLASLSSEQIDALEDRREETLATLKDSRSCEMSKILTIEQSLMARYRLADTVSLRLDSEEETASATVSQLIEDVRDEVDASLTNLKEGLETDRELAEIGEADIDAESWRESFLEELEKGLLLWDEAEEKLLVDRAEWEEEAGYDLSEAEEAWASAFEQLEEERELWLNEYQEVLEEGRELWENQDREMENALAEAEEELQKNIESRRTSLAERAEALVDILSQSLSMLSSARENFVYWLDKMIPGDTLDEDSISWDAGELRALYFEEITSSAAVDGYHQEISQTILASFPSFTNNWEALGDSLKDAGEAFLEEILARAVQENPDWQDGSDIVSMNALCRTISEDSLENFLADSLGELSIDEDLMQSYLKTMAETAFPEELSGPAEQAVYWLDTIYEDYRRYAEEAEEDLYATYDVTVFGESGLDDEGNLIGPIAALENGGWEELFLDDYQVELLKARAVASYWKKELTVAQAVADYALDESSGRDSQAETETAYSESLDAYQEALALYQQRIAELDEANTALDENKEDIEEVQAELESLKEELSEAQDLYQKQLLLFELQSPQYYQEQMGDLYERLLELSGLTGEGDLSTASAFADYLAAASSYESEAFLESTSSLLKQLVDGDYDSDSTTLSLGDLKARYEAGKAWDTGDYLDAGMPQNDFLAAFAEAWNLDSRDSEYVAVESLLLEFPNENPSVAETARFQSRISAITGSLIIQYKAELENLIAQITLLSSDDLVADAPLWAGETASLEEGMSKEELTLALQDSAESAEIEWITEKISFDLGILEELSSTLGEWIDSGEEASSFQMEVPEDFNEAFEVLGWIYTFQEDENDLETRLAEDLADLEELADLALKAGGDLSLLLKNLASVAETNQLAVLYLESSGLFVEDDYDYSDPFLVDASLADQKAVQAQKNWTTLGRSAPSMWEEHRDEALSELESLLLTRELASGSDESLILADPSEAWEDLAFSDADSAVDWMAEFGSSLDNLLFSYDYSDATVQALYQWRVKFETFFLTQSLSLDGGMSNEEEEDAQSALEVRAEAVSEDQSRLERLESSEEPLIGLSMILLITSEDEDIATFLTQTLAAELAARIFDLETNLEDLSTWRPLMDELLDDLELEDDEETSGLLEEYFEEASVLAAEAVNTARTSLEGEVEEDLLDTWIRTLLESGCLEQGETAQYYASLSMETISTEIGKEYESMTLESYRLNYQKNRNIISENLPGSYRQYLGKAYFLLNEDEYWSDEEEEMQAKVDEGLMTQEAFDAMTSVDPSSLSAQLQSDEIGTLWGSDEGLTAALLESYNGTLDSGGNLLAALYSWRSTDFSEEAIEAYRTAAGFLTDIDSDGDWEAADAEELEFFVADASMAADLSEALEEYQEREAELASLTASMATYGESIAEYTVNIGNLTESFMADAKAAVKEVNERIAETEAEWAALIGETILEGTTPETIGNAETYREAEYLYGAAYEAVQASLDALEEAKQAYKIAKAIREYAASGYLKADETSAEDIDIDDATLAEELEEAYEIIDAVDPIERLEEVYDQYRRSLAVVETLEAQYAQEEDSVPLAERDETYNALTGEVEEAKRDEIALSGLTDLLEAFTDTIQVDYEEAVREREAAFTELTYTFADEEETTLLDIFKDNITSQSVLLKGMDVSWDADGIVQITYGNPAELVSDDPERLERLRMFFGLDEAPNDYQTYEDLLDILLLTLDEMGTEKLKTWFGSATYETMAYWKPQCTYTRTTTDEDGTTTTTTVNYSDIAEKSLYGVTPGERNSFDRFFRSIADNLYNQFQSNYNATTQNTSYQFFKFLYWSDCFAENSSLAVSLQKAGEYWTEYVAYDKTEGRISTPWRRFWKTKKLRDIRRERDERKEAWNTYSTHLNPALTEYANLSANEDRLQAYAEALSGENSASIESLFDLLGAALEEGEDTFKSELADWLALDISGMTNLDYDERIAAWSALLEEHFANTAAYLDEETAAQAETPTELLTLLLCGSSERLEETEKTLDLYLYDTVDAGDEERGIADIHNEDSTAFAEALETFQESGLLPPDGLDLEAAESALVSYTEDETTETLETEIHAYLNTYDTESDEAYRLQRSLAEEMAEYENLLSEEEETLAALQFSKIADLYAQLIEAYRIGETFLQASESAWHLSEYNQRQVLLDQWNQDEELYAELSGGSSTTASLAAEYQLPRLIANLQTVYDARMEAYSAVKQAEADTMLQEEELQKSQWENQMTAILARGQMEWKLAKARLETAHETWLTGFQETFQDTLENWGLNYLAFLEAKADWSAGATEDAVNIGSSETLARFGQSTQDAIADATNFIIADLPVLTDLSSLMDRILNRTMLSSLIGTASSISDGIGAIEPVLFTSLGKNPYTTGDMLDKIRSFQTEENEELSARLALVQYEHMLDTLDDAARGLEEQVADANESVGGSMRKLFINEGFRQSGKNFVKKSLVAATLWKNKYKTHSIQGYKDYRANIRDLSSEAAPSDESMVEDLGSQGIQALLARAMKGLEEEQERIFGGESTYIEQKTRKETETYMTKSYTQDGYTWVERTRSYTVIDFDDSLSAEDYQERQAAWEQLDDKQKQNSRLVELQGGEFNLHVGYAPQFKSNADGELSLSQWKENVRFEGAGEQGRIIGLYQQHMLIEGTAEAEFDKPAYEKKLWDDRGSDFKAINLRTVVDIGVTIATSFIPGANIVAMMGAAALNLADDVLFTFADVGTGYKSTGDAFGALGKKSLASFATSAINVGFNGVDGAGGLVGKMGDFGDNVVGSTLMKGTQILTTNITTSAINAMDLSAIGTSNFWNQKAFTQGAFGKNAWASVASGMAGNLMTSTLNTGFTTGDFGTAMEDWSSLHNSYLGQLSSTVGGLTSTAVTYGMTGNATINLLNSSMFGAKSGTGLLELHFGDDGFYSQIGMSGTDLNLTKLYQSVLGMNVAYQNSRSLAYQEDNSYEAASILRTSYSYGDKASRQQYSRIMKGTDNLFLNSKVDDRAQTIANGSGGRNVYLSTDESTDEARLIAAVVLAHEAYRDGVSSDELYQQMETRQAAQAHSETAMAIADDRGWGFLASDEQLFYETLGYAAAKASGDLSGYYAYVEGAYDSNADYWKLIRNGDSFGLIDDHQTDFDLSELGLGEDVSPEEFRQMIANMTSSGEPRFENAQAFSGANRIVTEEALSEFLETHPEITNVYDFAELLNENEIFRDGTYGAIEASTAIDQMIALNAATQLDRMNAGLMRVQNSGILFKNAKEAIDTTGLTNLGNEESPFYVPYRESEGRDSYITSLPGLRILEPEKGIEDHGLAVDIGGIWGNDYVAALDGSSLSLSWDETYGLVGSNAFSINGVDYMNVLGHMEIESSLMAYLSNFGTVGTTLTDGVLHSLDAGAVIGAVGNTGDSDAAHLDWRILIDSSQVDPMYSGLYDDYLGSLGYKYGAQYLSGIAPSGSSISDTWNNPDTWGKLFGYVSETGDLDYWTRLNLYNGEYPWE